VLGIVSVMLAGHLSDKMSSVLGYIIRRRPFEIAGFFANFIYIERNTCFENSTFRPFYIRKADEIHLAHHGNSEERLP